MARGGYRPGAGRPKSAKSVKAKVPVVPKIPSIPDEVRKAARKSGKTPLDYMLEVMNDEEIDAVRRDRMAIAAAPFVHAKVEAAMEGKKVQRQASAEAAASSGKYAAPSGPKLAVDNTR